MGEGTAQENRQIESGPTLLFVFGSICLRVDPVVRLQSSLDALHIIFHSRLGPPLDDVMLYAAKGAIQVVST